MFRESMNSSEAPGSDNFAERRGQHQGEAAGLRAAVRIGAALQEQIHLGAESRGPCLERWFKQMLPCKFARGTPKRAPQDEIPGKMMVVGSILLCGSSV